MFRFIILFVFITEWATVSLRVHQRVGESYDTLCGDTWTRTQNYYIDCICGEEKLSLELGLKFCCVDPSPDNSPRCYFNSRGQVLCPEGRVLNKDETCHGLCYNDYAASEEIQYGSYFRCGNGKCVSVDFMCQGYSLCEDRTDVTACNENLTCFHNNSMGNKDNRRLVTDLTKHHHYCEGDWAINDGLYDTISRVDETDLDINNPKVRIDYSGITECTVGVYQGLMCGNLCVENFVWCAGVWENSCGKFSTTNNALCSNSTFWNNKTCELFFDDGVKSSLGTRCTGRSQNCIYPWYLSGNYFYEVRSLLYILSSSSPK